MNSLPPETTDPVSTITFESLGIQPEYFASLARADEFEDDVIQIKALKGYNSFIYKNSENGFVSIEFKNNQYEDGSHYMSYINDDDTNIYYIPTDMKVDFNAAIAAYNNAQ